MILERFFLVLKEFYPVLGLLLDAGEDAFRTGSKNASTGGGTWIGGANISVESGASATQSLNNVLITFGSAVGAVLVVVAVIKLIMAISSEQAAGKQQGAMMLASGIFFLSISAVVKTLGMGAGSTVASASQMAKNVITVICTMCTYAGGGFAIVGFLDLILATANEAPEQKLNGAKFLGGAAGLLSANALGTTIKSHIGGTVNTKTIVLDVGSFLGKMASYIGGVFVAIGIWYLINGIRTEESKDRDAGVRALIAGIGLISARAVLYGIGLAAAS